MKQPKIMTTETEIWFSCRPATTAQIIEQITPLTTVLSFIAQRTPNIKFYIQNWSSFTTSMRQTGFPFVPVYIPVHLTGQVAHSHPTQSNAPIQPWKPNWSYSSMIFSVLSLYESRNQYPSYNTTISDTNSCKHFLFYACEILVRLTRYLALLPPVNKICTAVYIF